MIFQLVGYELTEKLHESNSTLIYRAKLLTNHQPLILKILKPAAATPDNLANFRREFATLSQLNFSGVIAAYALEAYQGSLLMTMEDIDGLPLDRVLAQEALPVAQCLSIAIELTDIIGRIHRQQIIHKDINPAHIIWNARTARLQLIDFGLVDDLSQQCVEMQHPTALQGTLPYISPEQTGRVNRAVDYRTDFYSLGITLYQMLTGKLPFEADDALGLVHCHIAQSAIPPADLNPDVPEMVSDIVLKLMAKMAEDRYQSVSGLKADLERCRHELTAFGSISRFRLGQEDISKQFQLPQKLYGRTDEIEQLLAAFDRACEGKRELLFVSGYAGIGKTALVHEIHRPITAKRGNFIEGKFDQWERNIPYSGWIQAFSGLVRYLLMESESRLAAWRQGILRAVGTNGKILTDVIPDWKLVIGPQPEVSVLPPLEAQNRFRRVFQDMVKFFATAEHPLTIFLDDLQWADQASLQLIEPLLDDPDLTHFLFIGSYREAEIDSTHPLARLLERRAKTDSDGVRLILRPLGVESIEQMLTEMLQAEPDSVSDLALLVHGKTDGNPFFVVEFLKTLHQTGLVTFAERWQWDLEQIRQAGISDNVVDLMIGKLRQLPVQTCHILSVAACLGVEFDRDLLAQVCDIAEDEILQDLWNPIRDGLVVVMGETTRFIHDKVSEAAYAIIPEAERPDLHYQIGKAMLAGGNIDQRGKDVFRIAEQLNPIQARLTAEEKAQLFQVNLIAARQAKASAANDTACRFFRQAAGLLPPDAWETDYSGTLALFNDWAESEYVALNFMDAETLFDLVLSHAKTLQDKIRVYKLQLNYHETAMHFQDAVGVVLNVLKETGIPFPPLEQIDQTATQGQLTRFLKNLETHPMAELDRLPEAVSPYKEAIEILAGANALFWIAYPNAAFYEVLEAVNLTLEHGTCPLSARCFGVAGFLMSSAAGQIELGYSMAEASLKMVEFGGDLFPRPEVWMYFYNWVAYWRNPLRYGGDQVLLSYYDAVNTGNNLQAAYSLNNYLIRGPFAGDPLTAVKDLYDQFTIPFYRLKQPNAHVTFEAFKQLVYNLQGYAADPFQLEGEFFSASKTLPQMWELKFYVGVGVVAFCELYLRCSLGDFAGALRLITSPGIEDCLKALVGVYGLFLSALFSALTYLQNYASASEADQLVYLAKAEAIAAQLKSCADQYPPNFMALYCLASAEIARVKGEYWQAVDFYTQAINVAHAQEFTHIEALANELAAKFWLGRGQDNYAQSHIVSAFAAYQHWEARAKVALMETQYSHWLALAAKLPSETNTSLLDANTIIKASQAITSEIERERLLATIMNIVIENAGAERGYLIENKNDHLLIQAKGTIGQSQTETPTGIPVEESEQVPLSVVYYVARSHTPVVLEDAADDTLYSSDPYIVAHKTRSLLCLPIVYQGKLSGLLYLENNLVTNIFTPDRLEFLKALAAQAAISLENAQLYGEIRRYADQLEQQVHERTNELEQERARLGAILEGIAEAVIYIDIATGQTQYVNRAFTELTGRAPERVLNKPLAIYRETFNGPRDYEQFIKAIEQVIAQNNVWRGTFNAHRRDGIPLELQLTANSVPGTSERLAGVVVLMRDIGPERALQAQKDRFIASASHELRTPITSLKLRLYLIQRQPEMMKEHLAIIEDTTKHLATLVESLLEISRFERGVIALRRGTIILQDVIEAAIAECQLQAESKHIQISDNLASSPLRVYADPTRIRQVADNLIINAINYTPEGGHIWVETFAEQNHTAGFRVQDNGIGISAESISQLFVPFYRVMGADSQGTGLGLAIVKEIIDLHGGKIAVESEINKGSTFSVSLPLDLRGG